MLEVIMNNIFSFATGELSQDAFICWCLNWINEPDNVTTHRYRQLGLDLLAKLIDKPLDKNNGQPFINLICVIDSKLRKAIGTFNWKNFVIKCLVVYED